jgi:hypothetical protein
MREQGKVLPKCVPPSIKLYGRGGHSGSELQITAEVSFQMSLDSHTTVAPVFVQPDSDIPCLLGMNVGLGMFLGIGTGRSRILCFQNYFTTIVKAKLNSEVNWWASKHRICVLRS